jgi:hypothetical protein
MLWRVAGGGEAVGLEKLRICYADGEELSRHDEVKRAVSRSILQKGRLFVENSR